jgi:hypothetical protein
MSNFETDKEFVKRKSLPSSLRDVLREGKYTKWMADYSDDQLAGLLWFVGEVAMRHAPKELPKTSGGERRYVGALNALGQRVPLGLDDAKAYMRACVGLIENEPEIEDLPTRLLAADEEIGRLRAEVRVARDYYDRGYKAGREDADAEINRLREQRDAALLELEALRASIPTPTPSCSSCEAPLGAKFYSDAKFIKDNIYRRGDLCLDCRKALPAPGGSP